MGARRLRFGFSSTTSAVVASGCGMEQREAAAAASCSLRRARLNPVIPIGYQELRVPLTIPMFLVSKTFAQLAPVSRVVRSGLAVVSV